MWWRRPLKLAGFYFSWNFVNHLSLLKIFQSSAAKVHWWYLLWLLLLSVMNCLHRWTRKCITKKLIFWYKLLCISYLVWRLILVGYVPCHVMFKSSIDYTEIQWLYLRFATKNSLIGSVKLANFIFLNFVSFRVEIRCCWSLNYPLHLIN
jgi:hypothetical protein